MPPRSASTPDAASGAARTWHPHEGSVDDRTVPSELVAALWAPGPSGIAPTRDEMLARRGEIRALVAEAEDGELGEEAWRAVARDPDLWELRWSWDGLLVRGYFHEPQMSPGQAVLAHVHVKEIVQGDDMATRAKQDARIDCASHRIRFCSEGRWGLAWSAPLFPRR